jgi:hypothetical protein
VSRVHERYDTAADPGKRGQSEHYARVASRITRDTTLSADVRFLILLLIDVAEADGTFNRRRASLAQLAGWSLPKFDRVMAQAKAAGYVEVTRTGRANEWRLTDLCKLRPQRRLRAVPDDCESSPVRNQSHHHGGNRFIQGEDSIEEDPFEEDPFEEGSVSVGARQKNGGPPPLDEDPPPRAGGGDEPCVKCAAAPADWLSALAGFAGWDVVAKELRSLQREVLEVMPDRPDWVACAISQVAGGAVCWSKRDDFDNETWECRTVYRPDRALWFVQRVAGIWREKAEQERLAYPHRMLARIAAVKVENGPLDEIEDAPHVHEVVGFEAREAS